MDDTIGFKAFLFAYFEHGVGEASKTKLVNLLMTMELKKILASLIHYRASIMIRRQKKFYVEDTGCPRSFYLLPTFFLDPFEVKSRAPILRATSSKKLLRKLMF